MVVAGSDRFDEILAGHDIEPDRDAPLAGLSDREGRAAAEYGDDPDPDQ